MTENTVPTLRCVLVREGPAPDPTARISNPGKAGAMLARFFEGADREMMIAMLLSSKNDVIGINVISVGSLNASVVHPREVFRPAVLAPAAAIILAHNHPSGDTDPSREDKDVTARLVQAGHILGIEILDHLIFGQVFEGAGKFHSLRETNPNVWQDASVT